MQYHLCQRRNNRNININENPVFPKSKRGNKGIEVEECTKMKFVLISIITVIFF